MNETREPDVPDDLVNLATTLMVVALSISLSACLYTIVKAVWPYALAALEATRFAP